MDYFQKAVRSIVEAVKIDSTESAGMEGMPFGEGVHKALMLCLNKATECGFKSVNLDGYVGYSDYGKGDMFGILGHVDVVPIGEGWSHEQGEIADGVLYGRGVMDDKGPMLLCLYAIKELIDEGYEPVKTIRMIWGADEESGWKCIEHYNKVAVMPSIGISPDADFPVIFAEKGIVHYTLVLPKISKSIIDIKGGMRVNMVPNQAIATLKLNNEIKQIIDNLPKEFVVNIEKDELVVIEAKGVSAHGSHPDKGENAITKLLQYLSIIDKNLLSVYQKLRSINGESCELNIQDDVSGKLTLNIGLINLINDNYEIELDIRYPISYEREFILEKLQKSIKDANIIESMNHASLFVEKDSELVTTLMNAYTKVTGDNTEPISIGGGTYARALPLGVAFGPILPNKDSSIHEVDERASLEDLNVAYRIYKEAIKNLCFN